jgi:hypothetical protein
MTPTRGVESGSKRVEGLRPELVKATIRSTLHYSMTGVPNDLLISSQCLEDQRSSTPIKKRRTSPKPKPRSAVPSNPSTPSTSSPIAINKTAESKEHVVLPDHMAPMPSSINR